MSRVLRSETIQLIERAADRSIERTVDREPGEQEAHVRERAQAT
jgi:hypothetical protein